MTQRELCGIPERKQLKDCKKEGFLITMANKMLGSKVMERDVIVNIGRLSVIWSDINVKV